MHDENIQILIQIGKPKLSVYPRAGTSQFLTRDLATPNSTVPISYKPVPLATGPIRNAKKHGKSPTYSLEFKKIDHSARTKVHLFLH